MKFFFTALSFACLMPLLAGCAPGMKPEIVRPGDYGPPPPGDYQERIKADFASRFADNDSSIFVFEIPEKGFTGRSRVGNMRELYGWVVCGTVDRRKRLGGYEGYSGPVPFYVMFRNGIIVQRLMGRAPDNEYRMNYAVNSMVRKVCRDAKSAAKVAATPEE
jgi:hypothetical protein